MDWEMLTGMIFVIVIVSVVMGTIGGIAKRHIRYKERAMELKAKGAPEGAISPEKARQIEDRLRVLERIVTDKDDDLTRQIEALRESGPRIADLRTEGDRAVG